MKLLRKFFLFSFLFLLLLVAAVLCRLYSGRGSNNLSLDDKNPEARYVLLGNIERNTAAINRWLAGDSFKSVSRLFEPRETTLVIAHYQNPYPTEKEKKLLAQCGLDLVTLPFLSDEELEFMEKTSASQGRENLSLLYPGEEKIPGTTFLHLTPADDDEAFAALPAGDNQDTLVVKVSPAPGDETGDNPPFLPQARLAAEKGARIIIGDHGKDTGPLEIWQENSLLVAGLGSFLGEAKGAGSLLLIVGLYQEGLRVEAYPLTVNREGPTLLNKPWHYLKAQKILKETLPPCFTREPFRGVYVSSSLSKKEEAEIREEDGIRENVEKNMEQKSESFGVAAAHPLAVEAGMKILREGGNAVDAAIATAFALGVVEPQGSGLGGGGIMLIHLAAENRQVVIDYRETAPYNISKEEIEKIMNWPSTGIPGFVKGLELAAVEYGSMPYAKLIEPAFVLARDGFPMSPDLRRRINSNSGKLARGSTAMQDFFRGGWPAPVGEIITQPVLAKTLKSIMEEGSSVFYEGYIADSLLAVLAKQGMNISKDDLKTYEPVIQEAISAGYRGFEVVTVPPPAGGVALLQQLMILNHFSLAESEPGPEIYSLLVQVLKAAYSDRRNYVGDPRFVHVPLDDLLSEEYILEKVNQINNGEVPLEIFTDPCRPSDNTTHLVVKDAEGNWVSMTNTISYLFGYGLQAEGFFLNTQLNNFSTDTRSPNYYQPGKRPFSHISPTLVFKDDCPFLGLGTPGGRRIPAFLVQVLVHHIDYGWDIKTAATAPRFWSEGKEILVETGFSREVLASFRKQGLFVTTQKQNLAFGRFSVLYLDEKGQLDGTGDSIRGEGKAVVENLITSPLPLP